MIKNINIDYIQKLINNKKLIDSKLLSDSFGINCVKFTTEDNETYVAKYYKNNNHNYKFNAIKSEKKNLIYLNYLNLNFFPEVFSDSDNYILISYLENNNKQPDRTKEDLLDAIISMHKITDKNYGFDFDTQIGGLRQKNKRGDNWIEFYREKRLGYIYELISKKDPMDRTINNKIDLLLKNLENRLPNKPKASLLHGDLWEGNILFNNFSFVGFIDPGSFYGHNELEVAYLRWFNPKFIDKEFLEKYNNLISIDKNFLEYEPIYQLYYSLLNVHLWDRIYINDVKRLLDQIKI